jgi:hypothetical protein
MVVCWKFGNAKEVMLYVCAREEGGGREDAEICATEQRPISHNPWLSQFILVAYVNGCFNFLGWISDA